MILSLAMTTPEDSESEAERKEREATIDHICDPDGECWCDDPDHLDDDYDPPCHPTPWAAARALCGCWHGR